ncbi:hypothetical protein NDU88_003238 [Pleurodeles waltl]|uniref:Uncharacterized protein n=1 Tax=Pleurodeles waltl TaxID=8319 RepID=A0AAV7M3S8_PLEWA|nr:hypothetical protein NDU88_003238 [Pleurodeles waltl]
MAAQTTPQGHASPPVDQPSLEAPDRILQEIASVGRCWEVMDLKITDLTLATSSIRADIAGFRETVTNLDQRLSAVEDHVAAIPDQEEELRSLRMKLTDPEGQSRRDNVRFFDATAQRVLVTVAKCEVRAYGTKAQRVMVTVAMRETCAS